MHHRYYCEIVIFPREPHLVAERLHCIDILKRIRRFLWFAAAMISFVRACGEMHDGNICWNEVEEGEDAKKGKQSISMHAN